MLGIGDFMESSSRGRDTSRTVMVHGVWIRRKKSTSAVQGKEVYGQEARGEGVTVFL